MTSREKQLVDMLRRVLGDGAHSTTLETEAKELIEAFEHPPNGRELLVHELVTNDFYVHVVGDERHLFCLCEVDYTSALGHLFLNSRWRNWQLDGILTHTMLYPLTDEDRKTWNHQLQEALRKLHHQ